MIKKCPVCNNEPAVIDPTLGVLRCTTCQNATRARGLTPTVEFTSESIKEERKKYKDDILQPFRQGEVSKEYLQKYGTQGIEVTEEEIKKAVNTTDSYYG